MALQVGAPMVTVRFLTSIALLFIALVLGGTGKSIALPENFKEVVVIQNLTDPTAVRFSPDGRVFVAEKSGVIKVFDNLTDTTPTVVADLGPKVHNYWDRGLLSLALHPDFPATPYIYALYTYNFDPLDPAHPAPRYPDFCEDRDPNGMIIGPGPSADGCVVNGRISRLTVNRDNTLVGGEKVLLENRWCQQFPGHSVGSLVFGPEGALYASAGDGATSDFEDWGQTGGTRTGIALPTPANPCGDPTTSRGTPTSKPDAEGGALRAQSVRTPDAHASLDGSIVRLDPDTGAAWRTNPLIGGPTAADDPVIAYGFRQPFRITSRPGTSEIWVGEVGWYDWEEINRIDDPDDSVVENFGWPCFEGPDRLAGYNDGLHLCTSLAAGDVTASYFRYEHDVPLYAGDPCEASMGSSISGLAFYQGGVYPAAYDGALFFSDFSRGCVWVMTASSPGSGDPLIGSRTVFLSSAVDARQVGDPYPVELQTGPGGDLFVVDHVGGTIRRITYNAGNAPPTARIHADPVSGPVPLTVSFDGSSSTDPDPGTTLTHAWDLDGDGQYDDASMPQATYEYRSAGDVIVGLRVTDDDGASSSTTMTIAAGNAGPQAVITTPIATGTWRVGEAIGFSGLGQDVIDGNLGPQSMRWEVILRHCDSGPDTCHEHEIAEFEGIDGGSFTAPDHPYYSELKFVLTVTDSSGLSGADTVTLTPEAVMNTYESSPPGATLSISGFQAVAPFSRGSILGSSNSLVAASRQMIGGTNHYFVSWDDGGVASLTFVQDSNPLTFRAIFAACEARESACDGLDNNCDGKIDNARACAGSKPERTPRIERSPHERPERPHRPPGPSP